MLKSITSFIRKLAEDPRNKDPMGLFQMVRPTLGHMGLAGACQNNKTQIVEPNKTDKKGNILYRVLLRRDAVIDDVRIDRIKREEDSFESLQRSKTGEMELFLYGPPPPQEEAAPE